VGVNNDIFEYNGMVNAEISAGGGDVSVEASCEWRQNLVQENEKCG